MSKEHETYIKEIKFNKIKVSFLRLLILISFVAFWEISANLKWVDPFLSSSPSRMLNSFFSFYTDGTIFRHIYTTCYETILGFSLGTFLGTIIAIALWWCPLTAKVLEPYLVVLNALPKVALAPIIIFWVGNGTLAIIIIALLISIVTTIISVFTGFKEIDKEKLLLMKTFQASKVKILRYLIIPYSIPILISALKINVGLSWVGVIMGEFLVAREGLGFLIVYGGQISQLNMVMMSIVILSFLAFVMYKLVALVENRYLKDS